MNMTAPIKAQSKGKGKGKGTGQCHSDSQGQGQGQGQGKGQNQGHGQGQGQGQEVKMFNSGNIKDDEVCCVLWVTCSSVALLSCKGLTSCAWVLFSIVV